MSIEPPTIGDLIKVHRYNRACDALTILNRMPNSEFKTRHLKRVFTNMNRLRAGYLKSKERVR